MLPSNGSFTIQRFKGWLEKCIRPQYRGEFKARLQKVYFNQRFKPFEARIEKLRHAVFAHLDRDVVFVIGDLQPKDFVDLRELSECCTLLRQFLDALSIGSRNLFLPVEYVWTSHESDIDEILRLIAEASGVLHMPEENATLWNGRRETLLDGDPSKLRTLNKYRRMLDLPEV